MRLPDKCFLAALAALALFISVSSAADDGVLSTTHRFLGAASEAQADSPGSGDNESGDNESGDNEDDNESGDNEGEENESGEDDDFTMFELSKTGKKCQSAGFQFGPLNHVVDYNDPGWEPKPRPKCASASSNAHGTYNSHYKPCEFLFHNIPPESDSRSGSTFQLSTACSTENTVKDKDTNAEPLFDYVRGWQDECVGDYSRCYSVSRQSDAKIVLKYFCDKGLEIPEEVTHISVNCMDDKKQALEDKDGSTRQDPYSKNLKASRVQEEKHHREKVTIVLGIVTLCCCSGWLCIVLSYKYVVVPYLKNIKRSKSDPDLRSLTAAIDAENGDKTP